MTIKRWWEPIEYSEYHALIAERDELKSRLAEYGRRARWLMEHDDMISGGGDWEATLLIRDLSGEKEEIVCLK